MLSMPASGWCQRLRLPFVIVLSVVGYWNHGGGVATGEIRVCVHVRLFLVLRRVYRGIGLFVRCSVMVHGIMGREANDRYVSTVFDAARPACQPLDQSTSQARYHASGLAT